MTSNPTTDTISIPLPELEGHVAAGFEPVAEAFLANWADQDEIGAGFAVRLDGELVVDIHAGWADRKKTRLWQADTLVPVYSTGKAVAALVIARLVDRGLLDYDAPVADFWPEFAASGKSSVTVAQALSHQAGLSGLSEEMDAADWFNAKLIEAKLARQTPLWELGTGSGYHPVTFGFIVDVLARRTDGRSIGAILREDICGPGGIDFHIGLPESEHGRVAEHAMPRQLPDLGPTTPVRQLAFLKPWSSPGRRGATEWRMHEFPAANGHSTARALARLMSVYADGGRLENKRFISSETLEALTRERVCGPDKVLPFDLSWGAGVMRNTHGGFYGPEPAAVGHSGWGGSCAMADPVRGLSAAYVMNRQKHHLAGDPRPLRLIEALYGCL
ncbi:serine hydrolase domain-containing protein [uncultured Maricaulis sp.]|uniref:serine hydrolase domain-containing protein n=1 Tax=uncultured Maricaulis sp. TaxID=174710 RepID=UPI0030D7D366|tara:strand:+ start:3462 stop:4625 length:1164 start_codon:yes stop_codon:yes gene_type:complete